MDAVVATKRFSQVGGLQLDQDVRALVAYAGELTQRPVRDKFAELTQVGPPPPLRFAAPTCQPGGCCSKWFVLFALSLCCRERPLRFVGSPTATQSWRNVLSGFLEHLDLSLSACQQE